MGQTETTIKLNFKTKEFSGLKELDTLKPGETYKVAISGLNQNLYGVTINNKDTLFKVEPLNFDLISALNLDPLTTLIANIAPEGVVANEVLSNKITFVQEALTEDFNFKAMQDEVYPTVREEYKAVPVEDQFRAFLFTEEKLAKARDSVLLSLKNELEEKIAEAEKGYYKYLFLDDKSNFFKNTTFDPIQFPSQMKKLRGELNQFQQEVAKSYDAYLTEIRNYIVKKPKLLEDNKDLKTHHETNVKVYEGLKSNSIKLSDAASPAKEVEILKRLIDKVNNQDTNFVSLPFMFTKDQTELKIRIFPKDSVSVLPTYETSLLFPTKEKRVFWGVSTGFYFASLKKDEFSLLGTSVPTSDTTSITLYTLVDEEISDDEYGMAAMIKTGYTFFPDFDIPIAIQAGIGPGVRIAHKLQPRFLIGGGVGFGDEHKFLIDFGFIMGPVDRLSNAYKVEKEYNVKPEGLMVSETESGTYWSISYLFNF